MAASDLFAPNPYAEPLTNARHISQTVSGTLCGRLLVAAEAVTDFILSAAAVFASYLFWGHVGGPGSHAGTGSLAMGLIVVLLLYRERAYHGSGSPLRVQETERALRVSVQSFILVVLSSQLWGMPLSSAQLLFILFALPSALILDKQIVVSVVRILQARGYGVERVLICAGGEVGRRIASSLLYSPRLGLFPVAIVDAASTGAASEMVEMGYRRRRSVPIWAGPLSASMLDSCRATVLILAEASFPAEERESALHIAKQAGVRVAFLTEPAPVGGVRATTTVVDGLQLTSPLDTSVSSGDAFFKRALDVALSALLLVVCAPLLLLIALLIRLESPGPVLFTQKRVGLRGKLFSIYKFRSMRMDTHRYAASPMTSEDARITRVGRILRTTSFDELPQLVNVLLGDMSLVGPRPEMPFLVEQYSELHRARLCVIPGITGLWQLSADRSRHIHENIQYDLYYIRNRTLFMDIAILVHTVFFAMRGV